MVRRALGANNPTRAARSRNRAYSTDDLALARLDQLSARIRHADGRHLAGAALLAQLRTAVLEAFTVVAADASILHDESLEHAGEPITHPYVLRVLEIIEERFSDPLLTSSSIAAELRRDRSYLAAIFHSVVGCTIRQHLLQVRVQHAVRMVANGDKVEAVVLAVGYRSKSNFLRHFRTATGLNPSAFRRALLSFQQALPRNGSGACWVPGRSRRPSWGSAHSVEGFENAAFTVGRLASHPHGLHYTIR